MDGRIERWQIRNLENCVGCVQCGRDSVGVTRYGHEHCGRAGCLYELREIETGYGLSYILRRYFAGEDFEKLMGDT